MRTGVGVPCELCELCEDLLVGVLGDLVIPGELLFDDWLDLVEPLEEDGDASCPLPAVFAFVVGISDCVTAFEAPVFGAAFFGVLVLEAVVLELFVFEFFVFESFVFGLFFLMEPVSESFSFASTAFRLATLGSTTLDLSTFTSSGRTRDCFVLSPPCC